MENKTAEYRVWTESDTIYFEGTMRLSGTEAYAPINELLDQVLAAKPQVIVLDLTNLEFLNSSGINVLAKFTIAVRKEPGIGIEVKGIEPDSVARQVVAQSKEAPSSAAVTH